MREWLTTTLAKRTVASQTRDILLPIRERLLHNTLLWLVSIFSFVLVLGALAALVRGNNPLEAINLGAYVALGIFWLLFFFERFVSYPVRVLGLLVALYITAVFALLDTGLMGQFRYNLLILVIIGTIFGGFQRGVILALLATGSALFGGFLVQQGFITPNPVSAQTLLTGEGWLREIIRFGSVTGTTMIISFQLIRESQRTFQRQQILTKQLEDQRVTLDSRITERTRALRLTAEVSRTLVMILDKDQLVLEVVEQIQKAFDYYHVHIYLLDEKQAQLLMAGGTGETGKALLMGKHKIEVGKGLVGRAALMGVPILVSDVTTDKYWLPNALLPETKSEIAVPIVYENKVMGVLDVQDNTPNGLSETDVDLLETIGNQLGVALTNASLYQRRTEQAIQQARLNEISNKIQFSTDLESTVQLAVREVGQSLRVKRTSILLDPNIPNKQAVQEETA